MTVNDYFSITLSLPPLPEQKKIATILTSVDTVIEKTQAQIDKLNDLKTGMMQELLTKGIGPDGKPHTEFKDSPVGRIPVGWEVGKIGALSKVIDSMHQTPNFTLTGSPMVRVTEIRKHEILDITEAALVDSNTFKEFSRNYTPSSNDILIARVGAYFGTTTLVSKNTHFCLGQNTAAIIPKDVEPLFLYIYLKSERCIDQMENSVAGGAQPSLSLKSIKDIKIPLPSREEQSKISAAIESINHKLRATIKKNSSQKKVKKALMQDLLTGKVRVTPDPE